jgi:hypothetical protein
MKVFSPIYYNMWPHKYYKLKKGLGNAYNMV